jgi:hypothetical protein
VIGNQCHDNFGNGITMTAPINAAYFGNIISGNICFGNAGTGPEISIAGNKHLISDNLTSDDYTTTILTTGKNVFNGYGEVSGTPGGSDWPVGTIVRNTVANSLHLRLPGGGWKNFS